jgi:hypothetical protein
MRSKRRTEEGHQNEKEGEREEVEREGHFFPIY